MAITRRKITVNATVSPILAKKLDEGVESEKYSSQSDAVSIALAEHFVHEEQREKEKKMAELYSVLIQHKEGRELLDEVPRTPKERADALTKAGIAHVEAGQYEEAKKCFSKAKELESGQLPAQKKTTRNPGRITYDPQKEKEDCLRELCPNPRELTPEEERKATEAKKRIKALFPEEVEEEVEEEFILE